MKVRKRIVRRVGDRRRAHSARSGARRLDPGQACAACAVGVPHHPAESRDSPGADGIVRCCAAVSSPIDHCAARGCIGWLADPRERSHERRHRRVRHDGRAHGRAAPARDPIQLHVVLGSRDRDPPAGRADVAAARRAPRRAAHGTLGPHAVRGARRHLGRRAQPLPAGRPARQPAAAGLAGRRDAPSARGDREAAAAVDSRRRGRRARRQGGAARRGGARSRRPLCRVVPRDPRAAQAHAARARAPHGEGQRRLRRPRARVARDRRDRLARRVPVRRASSRRRGRGAGAGRRPGRARAHRHPARRRHRLHRRRDSAHPALGGDQHREARASLRGGADRAAGQRRHGGDDRLRCRRGDPAGDECGGGGGTGLCRRPDVRRRVVHRRQRRGERGRQEGRAVGHRGRQPGVVAHGHARRRVARGRARRSQPGQDPRRPGCDLRAAPARSPRPRRRADGGAVDPRRDVPQGGARQGRHRQVPGRAARRAEGRLRRHRHQRAFRAAPDAAGGAHRLPRVLRAGARVDAGHRRDQGVPGRPAGRRGAGRARAPRRALREGGGLCDQGEAPRPAAHGAARRHRRRGGGRGREGGLGGRAHRQRPRRRGFRRRLGGGAPEVLAGPRAHGGDRQAHQRVQAERGRGDPARPPRRLHRRRRAHQRRALAREQARALRRARRVPRLAAAAARLGAGQRSATAAGAPRREGRGGARTRARGARPLAGPRRSPRHDLPPAAGPLDRGVVEGRAEAAARGSATRSTATCCGGGCSSRCTCTPATATSTPTSR